MFVTNGEAASWVTTILDMRLTGDKKYELFLAEGQSIYVGSFDAHLAETASAVTFREYEKTLEDYHAEKFYHKYNVEYLQKLTKYPSRYQEGLEEMEALMESWDYVWLIQIYGFIIDGYYEELFLIIMSTGKSVERVTEECLKILKT